MGDVTIRGGTVLAMDGTPPSVRDLHLRDGVVVGRAAGELLDASGCLVTPGLVNTHHHLFQTLTRAVPAARGQPSPYLGPGSSVQRRSGRSSFGTLPSSASPSRSDGWLRKFM